MCFRAYVTNWLLCQTHGIDPTVQPHWLYIWEHRWIVVLLLISVDWFKYSNSSASCYKCILNWFGCIVWRPKAIYLQKGTLNDRLRNKSNPYIFHTSISFEFSIYRVFIVPNLNCIHAIFTMLWPFQSMLGPRCSTGWSVAKLILGSVEYAHGFVALCLNIISFFYWIQVNHLSKFFRAVSLAPVPMKQSENHVWSRQVPYHSKRQQTDNILLGMRCLTKKGRLFGRLRFELHIFYWNFIEICSVGLNRL